LRSNRIDFLLKFDTFRNGASILIGYLAFHARKQCAPDSRSTPKLFLIHKQPFPSGRNHPAPCDANVPLPRTQSKSVSIAFPPIRYVDVPFQCAQSLAEISDRCSPKKFPPNPDTYNPCLSQSPNFAFPNCARLFIPCSLRSIPFNWVTSCEGALLTLCTIIVGSVSRIIPSSTISSIARETRS